MLCLEAVSSRDLVVLMGHQLKVDEDMAEVQGRPNSRERIMRCTPLWRGQVIGAVVVPVVAEEGEGRQLVAAISLQQRMPR
jgi:hypothetical protein